MDDTPSNPNSTRVRLRAMLASGAAAAALAGCSSFGQTGTTATSFLKTVDTSTDPNKRYVAYDKLARPETYDGDAQKDRAVQTLIKNLESDREPVASRAVICRTLGMLRRPEARPALLKAVQDDDGVVRAQACRALGRVGTPEDATALARVMTVDALEDCRIAAIEGLGQIKSKDPRIYTVLLHGMEHDDPAVRLASVTALRAITGKDRGVEVAAWKKELGPILALAPPAPGTPVDPVEVLQASGARPAAAPILNNSSARSQAAKAVAPRWPMQP